MSGLHAWLEGEAERSAAEHAARRDAGTGLPVEELLAGARRSRTRYGAALTAGAVAAGVAVVVAGASVAGLRGNHTPDLAPAPPVATGSPTLPPSPSPSPTAAPDGQTEEPPLEWYERPTVDCGTPEADVPTADDAAALGLTVTAEVVTPTMAMGVVALTTAVVAAEPVEMVVHHTTVVAVQDGVVVGKGRGFGVDETVALARGGSWSSGDAPMVSACPAGAMDGPESAHYPMASWDALPEGTYSLWPVLDVSVDGVDHLLVGTPATVDVATDTEPASVEDVPVAVVADADRVFDVARSPSTGTWFVRVEVQREGPATVAVPDRLAAAGLTTTWARGPEPQFWTALLHDDRWVVAAQVENWTGGGSYASYTIWPR